MTGQLLLNAVVAGASYALVAAGFGVIYVTARVFHFAHGAVYTAGGYGAYVFIILVGLPPAIGICMAVLAGSVLGGSIELVVYRPLRRRGADSVVVLLASLGIFVFVQNLVSLVFGDDSYVLTDSVREGLSIFGARATGIQLIGAFVSVSIIISLWLAQRFSRYGRMLRAVADDRELSLALGVPTESIVLLSLMVGSALAALGGILGGYDVALTPSMGFRPLLVGVVAAIIGGLGSLPGSLLGGLLLALAENVGWARFSSQWRDPMVFLILILFLLVRPQGLFGIKAASTKV